jgi:hypothetical protein
MCAGINCQPISFTGQHCQAYGFHDDLTLINDVPIATVATVWSNPNTGKSFIVIIHEALYFGDSMDHLSVNSNQLQAFEIDVYDNPYDMNPMGTQLTEYTHYHFNQMDPQFTSQLGAPWTNMSNQPWDLHHLVMPGGDKTNEKAMDNYARIMLDTCGTRRLCVLHGLCHLWKCLQNFALHALKATCITSMITGLGVCMLS